MTTESFIVSDLHRLLIAGLPAHCERFWTLPIDNWTEGPKPRLSRFCGDYRCSGSRNLRWRP
jgi:hypothetical protein